jgi:L-cysteine:1D-myo-inositol 2-amino-2-deoxy-alpha-D-glucopyranoside ligase
MRAWTSPDLPRLDHAPTGPVRVHDTATGELVALDPRGSARLYVCGITPYDATHIGHAATYVAFDLLNRAWRSAGHEVHYVQNVTDVDDPLLERASATGVDWTELAERETQLFREDMTALRVLAPDHYVGAVEALDLEIALISRLQEQGAVYDVDGDLYMDVHADPRFGDVSGLDEAGMLRIFPERGGDPEREGKKHPLDCLVWRAERPGEPAWDTGMPGIGRGRPGWHVECSAIALHHLGETFDVQGGGSDLVFPHHEMSAGHAQVARDGAPFARAYVHAGMVAYEGEKMSKSKGNLVLVSRLRADGVDPMAVRLAILTHHYRSDWEWTDDVLAAAESDLGRLRRAVAAPSGARATDAIALVRTSLAHDLDAPAAVAALLEWARATEQTAGTDPSAGAVVAAVADACLGLSLRP